VVSRKETNARNVERIASVKTVKNTFQTRIVEAVAAAKEETRIVPKPGSVYVR